MFLKVKKENTSLNLQTKSIVILLHSSIVILILGGINKQCREGSHVHANMLDICLHHPINGFEKLFLMVKTMLKLFHSLRHGEILRMSRWLRCRS
ncbi:Uncharacterized protein TCM_017944 [Theobroma cacao]|uniref:Uncharacterized protein n=1 Tax=Theobroma cacao TaxID=3641 RepID=A0A061EFV0_THECC|nr:Uncharacterized protein TCM_017944 [Theobroma cacao]